MRVPDPYTGPLTRGIDVSAWQGLIDWQAVAAAGYVYSWSRLSDALHADHTFDGHYLGARAAGIVPGAYQFFRPGVSTLDQAHIALDALDRVQAGPYDLPIALDVERGGGGGEDDPIAVADAMLDWIDIVRAKTGRTVVVYAGWFFASAVHDSRLASLPLWTPWYQPAPVRIPASWADSKRHFTFWQMSGTGHVPGIAGACDLDAFRGDRAAFDAFRDAAGSQ